MSDLDDVTISRRAESWIVAQADEDSCSWKIDTIDDVQGKGAYFMVN